jgi:hypothetical protein
VLLASVANGDGLGEILMGSNGKAFLLYGSSTYSTPVNLDTNAVAFSSSRRINSLASNLE